MIKNIKFRDAILGGVRHVRTDGKINVSLKEMGGMFGVIVERDSDSFFIPASNIIEINVSRETTQEPLAKKKTSVKKKASVKKKTND